MMAHRGFDGAVEIVQVVGAGGGRKAGACHKAGRNAQGALEDGGETLHIRQHSGTGAEVATGKIAVNAP